MASSSVQEALERYAATEPSIHAWVCVDPQEPLGSGPLDGVPFGVKDIFETLILPTEYGSALYAGRKGNHEARLVTMLRQLGAVLFGKTQTAAFAYFDPPPTRNPRNLAHTPGGSSSGSAAAVAAGVVPFALGSQTMGSVIRPASFCGVTGFKPTFGTLPVDGVLGFAPSLDTVGYFAVNAVTAARVWSALGLASDGERTVRFGIPGPLPAVSPEMDRIFRRSVAALDAIQEAMPVAYEDVLAAARLVNDFEGARSHRQRWEQFGNRIGEKLAALVSRGLQIQEAEYRDKLGVIQEAGQAIDALFDATPVLLTPAAPGAAPAGLASTGDPAMNAVWTAIGVPVVSIPMPVPEGLPLGLQMIARKGNEATLLAAAIAVEGRFASTL